MSNATQQMDQNFDFSSSKISSTVSFVEMNRSDPVALSQSSVDIAIRYTEVAKHFQPAILAIDQIFENRGQFFADLIFDEKYSNLSPEDAIKHASWIVRGGTRNLFRSYHLQSERVEGGRDKLKDAEDKVHAAEEALQRITRKAFPA